MTSPADPSSSRADMRLTDGDPAIDALSVQLDALAQADRAELSSDACERIAQASWQARSAHAIEQPARSIMRPWSIAAMIVLTGGVLAVLSVVLLRGSQPSSVPVAVVPEPTAPDPAQPTSEPTSLARVVPTESDWDLIETTLVSIAQAEDATALRTDAASLLSDSANASWLEGTQDDWGSL